MEPPALKTRLKADLLGNGAKRAAERQPSVSVSGARVLLEAANF